MAHGFDEPIPASLAIGRGAVLLVRGWMAPAPRVRELVVRLDDEEQRFDARSGQIRFDVGTVDGRMPQGFFLPIVVEARRAGTRARLHIAAGDYVLADQPIEFVARAQQPIAIDTPIAICLATYNPDAKLLARQLESVRAQTRRDWTCIIHDDGSRLERWATIEELTRSDERFRLFRAEENRGFYRNFEAALALVPPSTPYVALCDQDDVWYPDKLASCIARLDANPRAQLVYSDMRIVAADGSVVAPTYWDRRRNNFEHLDTLLFVNTVTGAASVLRGALLDVALPFPPAQGPSFHDHWLACAAFVGGGLDYIDRPLYDYTQHDRNVIGHAAFGPLSVRGALWRHTRDLIEMLVIPPRAMSAVWSALSFYYFVYLRVHVIAETLALRFPARSDEIDRTLALFDDRVERALELMIRRHYEVSRRGDTTDGIEYRMGMGLLLHKTLVPIMRPLVELKHRLLPRA